MKLYSIIAFIILFSPLQGQIIFTSNFTKKMEMYQINYNPPIETYLKVTPYDKDPYYTYDLALDADNSRTHIKVKLYPQSKVLPHMQFISFIQTLATNNQESDIVVEQCSKSEKELFNADWAAKAYIDLKPDLLPFEKALVVSLFKENIGYVMYAIYYDKAEDLLSYSLLFSFK